jgi:hypothetical protein
MMASRVMLVIFSALALVRGADIDSVKLMTSGNADECAGPTVTCDGGFEREFYPPAHADYNGATNVIAQVDDVKLKYVGALAAARYISLVDRTLNNNDPCTAGAYAAAPRDTFHSGPLQADTDKLTTVTAAGGVQLDATKEYAVCYSTNIPTDAQYGQVGGTWAASGIFLKVAKIEKITAYGRNFKTAGTIPHHPALTMTYTGTVLNERWISLVDATLNTNNPCADGAHAAAPLDSSHSGSLKANAGTKEFTVNTAALSGTKEFAVCYAESGGITSSQWRDSGIRVRRSRIEKMQYGIDQGRFGDGFVRDSFNRNTNDYAGISTDKFPQVAGAKLRYVGADAAELMHISLVDQTLNNNDPCGKPRLAAAVPTFGSPSANEALYSGKATATGKEVTIAQAGNEKLKPTQVYAVCYSYGDGSDTDATWADSYARYSISKVEALKHHSVLHATTGVLPFTGSTATEKLKLEYIGSLALGGANIVFTLVPAQSGNTPAPSPGYAGACAGNSGYYCAGSGVTYYEPCGDTSNAEMSQGIKASGVLSTQNSKKYFEIDTTTLSTGVTTGDTLDEHEFAVCYGEAGAGGAYSDSGIRVTVGKVSHISHGTIAQTTYAYGQRVMKPVENTGNAGNNFNLIPSTWQTLNVNGQTAALSPGLASSRNVIPQMADQDIKFFSSSQANPVMNGGADADAADVLAGNRFVSLVAADLNGNKPCAIGSSAAATADSTHSGAVRATASVATIPQNPLLDHTKVYAVCYAITSGTTADTTWADSYVRVTVSAVHTVTSLGVTHAVSAYDGQIAVRRTTTSSTTDSMSHDSVTGSASNYGSRLELTYTGALPASAKLSFVDETINARFPCATTFEQGAATANSGPTATPGATSTGSLSATSSSVLASTNTLTQTKTFAVCYSTDDTTWYDSGIRFTRSPIYSMRYSSGFANWHRDQTSVALATNRIPQATAIQLVYVDPAGGNELANDAYVSLVDAALSGGNPCVVEATAESIADSTHSGAVKATQQGGGAGGKYVTFDTSGLDMDKSFAVCYHAPDNVNENDVSALLANNGDVWKDSYIRLKVSQIEALKVNLGKWKGACLTGQVGCAVKNGLMGYPGATGNTITGSTQAHKTVGQLPKMAASDIGLELEYDGTLGASAYISLVDASLNPTTVGEVAIPNPCESGVIAAATPDSTHSGPHKGTTYGFCQSVDSDAASFCSVAETSPWNQPCVLNARCNPLLGTNGGCGTNGKCTGSWVTTLATNTLDTTKTYALCYTKATATAAPAGTSADTWRDSGVRLTISKISTIATSSRHPGVIAREQSSVFKPTNRVPTSANMKFTYRGDLAASQLISFVDASTDNNNPCVQNSVASGTASTTKSGALSADANNVFIVPNAGAAALSAAKIYAVCYAESATWYLDSGIRMGATQIESLKVVGIDITTTGQVPNTEAGLDFQYTGALAVSSWIALVEEGQNDDFPCASSVAGANNNAVSVTSDPDYSGYRRAGNDGAGNPSREVKLMETYKLSTSSVFALCYATGGDASSSDPNYADSGIRVTVPKVWNVMTASGYTGPACSFGGDRKVPNNCKIDTKPRDMTSKPLSTNRIANVANQVLTYEGDLVANQYLALVSAALNPSGPDTSAAHDDSTSGNANPCVKASVVTTASTTSTGAFQAPTGSNAVTFANANNLDASHTYAVCYSNGGTTWADSYVRLKITQIDKLIVRLPHVTYGTTTKGITTHQIPIKTHGQIPNSAANEQVVYQYEGALPTVRTVALVETARVSTLDPLTKWNVETPCDKAEAGQNQETNAANKWYRSGKHVSTTIGTETKVIKTLDSTTAALDPEKIYALCYTTTNGGGSTTDTGWADSGIRITVPKLHTVSYIGTNGDVLAKRVREMTSIHLPTNKLPASASLSLTYTAIGAFGTDKYVSLVAVTDALPTPCVTPALASANDADVAPRATATNRIVSFDVTRLDATKLYAVCYTDSVDTSPPISTDGELAWRDSYVRLSVSMIDKITSYQIDHLTTGQIPNHPQLKVDYAGTLPTGQHVKLIDASRAMTTMGAATYPLPCASATETGTVPGSAHTNIGTAASGTSTVTLNTVDLDVYDAARNIRYWDDMGVDTTEVYYAVCYSSTTVIGAYYDSGIRVTVPELINVQSDSGYSSTRKVCVKSSGTSIATNLCDHDFDNNFNGQCAVGTPCDSSNANNGGCGSLGACTYQEKCTAVGGMGVANTCDADFNGVFDETCVMHASCISTNAANGGCGSQGVCARLGTAVREQTSWAQTSGAALIETPTNRLAQVTGEELIIVSHSTADYGKDVCISTGGIAATDQCGVGYNAQCAVGTPCNSHNPAIQNGGCGATGVCGIKDNKISIVEVSSGMNSYNPCVLPSTAGKIPSDADALNTGTLAVAQATGIVSVTQGAGNLLGSKTAGDVARTLAETEAAIYAVCYANGAGTSSSLETWRDSYVRLKISRISNLITVGVTHKTTGQIPNVVTTDNLRYTYSGTLAAASYVSLVDSTLNNGLPCVAAQAGKTPGGFAHAQLSVWADKLTHSGVHQAEASKFYVQTFDTSYMDTSKVFALCYTDAGGTVSADWADSGLRLSLPKVYNVQYSSQTDGPNVLETADTMDGVCRPGIQSVACPEKLDTMPRGHTSNPLPTNTFPRGIAAALTYRGTLPAAKHLSLVSTDTYGVNPCVLPFYAGGPSSSRTTKSTAGTGSMTVTLPQTTDLEAEGYFAVCYAEGSGDIYDHTWRDSYIRLTISQVRALEVNMPHVDHAPGSLAAVNTKTTIVTHGQVPNQAGQQQVTYTMLGSISAGKKLSFTSAEQSTLTSPDLPTSATGYTGIANYQPCVAATAFSNNAAGTSTTSPARTATGTTVNDLDTTTLDTTKVFAVCYNPGTPDDWFDSGLRLTVSQIVKLQYKGQNSDVLSSQVRDMSSVYLATNTLPRVGTAALNYVVSGVASNLGTSGFISLVGIETAAIMNQCSGGCPCATPATAAASPDNTHSSALSATSSAFNVVQSQLLATGKLFAVCYASAGSNTDVTWRDSYIRLTTSEIGALVTHQVTHTVRGQIPSHPALLVDTVGSYSGISGSSSITLVDARLGTITMGSKTFPYPCSSAAMANGPVNTERAKFIDDATSTVTSKVKVDTTELDSSPIKPSQAADNTGEGTEDPGHSRYFAVCYLNDANSNTEWADSGIRVTVPEITNVQVNSGHGTTTRTNQAAGSIIPTANIGYGSVTGTPWRDQTSEFLATNRLPQMAGQTLNYIYAETSNACIDVGNGNPDANCAVGNEKYLSLVAASVNNNNPCVLTTETTTGADGTHTGSMTAASGNTKTVTVDASGLDDVTFAVCYSKGSSLWGATLAGWDDNDASANVVGGQSIWRDTYIRLKLSKVETITTLGVIHRTFGQVPDTVASDAVDFSYTGTLAAESYLSLVDASRNNENPCTEAGQLTHDTAHSTPAKAGKKKCVALGTSPTNGCDVSVNGNYDETCALNALCTTDAHCGSGTGKCSAAVSSMTTHGLSTNAGSSNIYVGRAAPVRYITARHFAVCYTTASGATFSNTWSDSGIRVSVSRIHSLRMKSDHPGTPDRDHTSEFLPTNRVPVLDNQYMTYYGDLAASKWISLVATTGNSNPCVATATAAAGAATTSTKVMQAGQDSNGQAMGAGALADYTSKAFDIDALADGLTAASATTPFASVTFAVCYNEHDGSNAQSQNWYDSYIRLQLTDVSKFGTKGVQHKTTGQIPHHKAGLVYTQDGTAALHSLALVDATANAVQVAGFSKTFPDPCHFSSASGTASTSKTGMHTLATNGGQKMVNSMDTTQLATTQTYAVCYSAGATTPTAISAAQLATVNGKWRDSGIRVTVSKLDSIYFSGYLKTEAAARGKGERQITSVLPSLQAADSIVAMVLPKMDNLPFRYGGDLGNSRYVSLVEVAGWTGTGLAGGTYGANPCVVAANAAGAPTVQASGSPLSGPVHGCQSGESLCHHIDHPTDGGAPATSAGNKEVTLPTKLDASKIYTVCYYDATATQSLHSTLTDDPYVVSGRTVTGSPTWVDSYIRVQISDVYSVSNAGVTHTDHGHIANHERGAALRLTFNTDTVGASNMRWFSLVDQSVGKEPQTAYGAGELNQVNSGNEPCVSAAVAAGDRGGKADGTYNGVAWAATDRLNAFLGHSSDRTGAFRGKQIVLHKLAGSPWSECGEDFSNNAELSAADKLEYAGFTIGEPMGTWGCPQSTTWSNHEIWTSTGVAGQPGANGEKFVVEAGTDNVVRMVTEGLDTSKVYTLCYTELNTLTTAAAAAVGAIAWRDSGIRVTISKVHTLRDNVAQKPMLTVNGVPAAGVIPMSMFARDLTSSRAKVGRSRCLYIGSNPTPRTAIDAVNGVGDCDVDGDGVYKEPCVVGAFCDPDLPDAPNGGCGGRKGVCNSGAATRALTAAAGAYAAATWSRTVYNYHPSTHKIRAPASGTLTMEYFGSLGGSTPAPTPSGKRQVALVDTTFNQGEPCASPSLLTHAFTSDAVHTAPSTVVHATSSFSFPAAEIQALSESKVYTMCYSASSITANEPWYDTYVRFTVSKVSSISSHGITHSTQAQIANSDAVAITYDGALGNDASLSLVSETENNYTPCSSGSDSADNLHSGAMTAAAGTKMVQFNTQALNVEINFAVCYKESGSLTWYDSGIRTTISRITRLEYNKKTSSGETACAFGVTSNCYISQLATEDYVRTMPSTNVAPASDAHPLATNRIAVNGGQMDFIYNGNLAANPAVISSSLGNGQFIVIVATSLNSDANPCVSQCAGDNACADDSTDGKLANAGTTTSGVITASANSGTFRVDQSSNNLDATKEYAVCYAQIDSFDQVTSNANDVDEHTFRDSYIRLLPSKVYSMSAYGIDHYTVGDIPAKPQLSFTASGTLAADAHIALVDATLNAQQPCDKAIAGKAFGALTTAEKITQTGVSTQVTMCAQNGFVGNIIDGTETANCDTNNDGDFSETCTAVGDLCNGGGCGGGACQPSGNMYKLKTNLISSDKTFAVCYSEGSGDTSDNGWTDAGIRVQTPQVQSVTYGSPNRVIDASACFDQTMLQATSAGVNGVGSVPLKGLADCKVPLATQSDAHYQIGAMLPRAADVEVSYNGPSNGAGLAPNKYISLVEHTTTSGENQKFNPCRDHVQAGAVAHYTDSIHPTNYKGTLGADDEGGKRLHSGAVQAAVGASTVTIPQTYSVGGNQYNRLDYTKTFAICYGVASAAQTGQLASNNGGWRDSYIRITLSKIKTLTMIHTGYPVENGMSATTIGTFTSVPSLEVQWEGSLMTNQYLRLTAASLNNNAPCDKSVETGTTVATAVTAGTSTIKVASLAASRRLTFDTSGIANPNQVDGFFAVCYALGNGGNADATWHDSGIRLRFLRWTNPEKHRVVSGAPVRLTFGISTGRFDTENDRVVILKDQTDCLTAISAPTTSDGSNVMRTLDYVCTSVDGTASATKCDARFDGSGNQKCVVGAMCDTATANAADNGGCGTNGKCEGAVQLPSGNTYAEIQDVSHMNEVAMTEGNYAMCVCLGSSKTGTSWPATANSYGPANGNGGCTSAGDYTLIFSSTAQNALHRTLKVISEPQLGRFADIGGQLTLRHVASKGHEYHIKTSGSTAGYQVADGDKIFFVPAGFGCGHSTKYSGDGDHVYHHGTNAYVSTGVDRRWRASLLHVCTDVDAGDASALCDVNMDGVYNEQCVKFALCDISNGNVGGCGTAGTCGSVIPATDVADRTAPKTLSGYSSSTDAASFTTPAQLSDVQQMTACFATAESLQAQLVGDTTDYVPLTHGLEVIAEPRFGGAAGVQAATQGVAATAFPGRVYAVEGSSPSFTVTSLKAQDMYYFVPQTQTSVNPVAGDCIKKVCTVVGGSNIGTNRCDSDHDGQYDDACVLRAPCGRTTANDNDNDLYNGGCGTSGQCIQQVPTIHTSTYTGLIAGSNFACSGSACTGKVVLPASTPLSVPSHPPFPTTWNMAICLIPAGAQKDLPSNVYQLSDVLSVIAEPTDSLVTSWFQYQVAELRFTQPQYGVYGQNFATGLPGDIIVLQKDNCNDVHTVDPSTYSFTQNTVINAQWDLQGAVPVRHSAKFVLGEAGEETVGDENGGTALENALAIGKVNELATGTYKICYATMASGGESQEDYKMLVREIEILPTPATRPSLSTPRSVILGQDVVVHWSSNIGLQNVNSADQAWLGLFEKDACEDGQAPHDCYIAFQNIHANEPSGTVIFSQADYKVSGQYEVRYFKGSSRNSQGIVCGGIAGVPHETSVACMLQAATESETIEVLGQDIEGTEELSYTPGLEAVFGNGNRGRYHRTKLT